MQGKYDPQLSQSINQLNLRELNALKKKRKKLGIENRCMRISRVLESRDRIIEKSVHPRAMFVSTKTMCISTWTKHLFNWHIDPSMQQSQKVIFMNATPSI